MNKRQAMREASRMLANSAYHMAELTGPGSLPYDGADRDRIQNALLLIANRLDKVAEGKRGEKPSEPEPVDPNQVSLFE